MMGVGERQRVRRARPRAATGLAAAVCALAFVASPAAAPAQEDAARPPEAAVPSEAAAPDTTGVQTHDGFLLRMVGGLGYSGYGEGHHAINFVGGEGVVQVGGALFESMTLAFEATGGYPMFFGAGFAIGVYLPSNFYLDGSIDYLFVEESGLRGSLTAGKEWWVGDQWGLGLALRTTVGALLDRSEPFMMWQTFVCLTATYN